MFASMNKTALSPEAGQNTKILRGPYLQTAIFQPQVFERVGQFDESYRQGDDTDFVLRCVESNIRLVLDDGIAAYYRRHDTNVTLNAEEVQREFMLASLKFAARRRRSGEKSIPPIFSQLFLSRDEIEKDFTR